MGFAGFLPRRTLSVAVVVGSAVGLSGCFDLAQKVAVRHDGSGAYAVEIAANGIVGEGLARRTPTSTSTTIWTASPRSRTRAM